MNGKYTSHPAMPTEEELVWACRIKAAASRHPAVDVSVVSDWEFLQHAVVSKGAVGKALERLERSQTLKNRYGIIGDGSMEAFERDWKTFQRLHAGFLGSVTQLENDGAHLWCQNMRCAANRSKTEEAYAVRVRVLFYCMQASSCNLRGIREGIFFIANCDGVQWRNLDFEQDKRNKELWSGRAYPVRVRRIYIWNLPSWARILYYMVAVLVVQRKIRQRILMCSGMEHLWQTRCALEHQGDSWEKKHLSTSWGGKVPDKNISKVFGAKLEERFANVKSFKLP